MKKFLLMAAMAMSTYSAFAFEDGAIVNTLNAAYQITGSTNYYNGGTDLTKWTAVSATGQAPEQIIAVDVDDAVGNYFYPLNSDQKEGIRYSLSLPAGTYVLSLKIQGPAAEAGVPLQATHNSLGYTFTKITDRLNYINVVAVDEEGTETSMNFDRLTIPSNWTTFTYAFEADGVSNYVLGLQGLNAGVKVADICVQQAMPVADLRKKDFILSYADAKLALLGYGPDNLPEDVAEIYNTFKGFDITASAEDFEAYYEALQEVMAEFTAVNLDDQLTDVDSHMPWAETKVQKQSKYGTWTVMPGGRGFVDPAPGYFNAGHHQGSTQFGGSEGAACGIEQKINLLAGKYVFKSEMKGYLREENGGSWEIDYGLEAVHGYMYVLSADGDTVAITDMYDISPLVFTPKFITFDIAVDGDYTVGMKAYAYDLYKNVGRGGELCIYDVELVGKTTAKYSKKEYAYETDVRNQIQAGLDAIAAAKGYYAEDSEYKWGKDALKTEIALYENEVNKFNEMTQDEIIATYDADVYDSSKGLEAINEDLSETPYYRLLASEVYRTAIKPIQDANKAFLAKNDTLNSLATAIEKAEAALVNRLYEASSEKAQLESEIATAKALLEKMQASEYSEDNAATIVAENEALANAVVTYQIIPADKLTSVVDIDFSNYPEYVTDEGGAPVTEVTITGAKGSMYVPNWSYETPTTEASPYEIGIDANGAKDLEGVFRIGNGDCTVDLDLNNISSTTNILCVSMDWWIGHLGGGFNGFYLKNDTANVSGIYFDAYNAKYEYDPCNIAATGKFFKSDKNGNAAHYTDANKTSFVLYVDYGTKKMQLASTTDAGTFTSEWTPFDGSEIVQLVIASKWANRDRRSFFDNLKVDIIEAGVPTGVQNVNTVKANNGAMYNIAGQAVSNNFNGIVVKNGKKFVK